MKERTGVSNRLVIADSSEQASRHFGNLMDSAPIVQKCSSCGESLQKVHAPPQESKMAELMKGIPMADSTKIETSQRYLI
jgi:hypothetical protein